MRDKILDKVYLIDADRKLLVPFCVDDSYGLASLNVVHHKSAEDYPDIEWQYRLRRSKGVYIVELSPALVLFGGRIHTPHTWCKRFIRCSKDQTGLIADWINHLNKVVAK